MWVWWLSGCGGTAEPVSHLECAAWISAAQHNSIRKIHPAPAAFDRASLAAMMTHLNSWAVPAGIAEQEAMAALHERRDTLLAEPPARVLEQASACVARIDG